MSTPSGGATSPPQCACTNIALMQLFHELKQKFPGVPDHVVSNTISLYCHDKSACESQLKVEAKASLPHAYHASSAAAARRLSEQSLDVPLQCRNQPIEKHLFPIYTEVKTVSCQSPQNAVITPSDITDLNLVNLLDRSVNIDEEEFLKSNNAKPVKDIISPVTINIDHCSTHNSNDSPSDLETVDIIAQIQERGIAWPSNEKENNGNIINKKSVIDQGTKNYKILKSNKVRSHLNEKLESKTTRKINQENSTESSKLQSSETAEKPKRPCTLEFAKQSTNFSSFGQQPAKAEIPQSESDAQQKQNPVTQEEETLKQDQTHPEPNFQTEKKCFTPNANIAHWHDQGYPVNFSVNVNCHMDILPSGNRQNCLGEPWSGDYSSPRAYTSVNLTVCTPTSGMQSPIRESAGGLPQYSGSPGEGASRGFEGHVTVTVSPNAPTRPTSIPQRLRRAPPVPGSQIPGAPKTIVTPDLSPAPDTDLITRQRARLARLQRELAAERARRARLSRETALLTAPPPAPDAVARLRAEVAGLNARCDYMARKLDRDVRNGDRGNPDAYIRGAPRPVRRAPSPPRGPDDAPPWECHVCTFRNHGLLHKCEECDMPRILVVRAGDEITLRLVPGRGKFVRSWVL